MSEKSMWNKLVEKVNPSPNQAAASDEDTYKNHPNYMKAQRQATEDYFKTGKKRPLKDYIDRK